jgi:tetratricopeptide (TPR) repeat protein
VAAAAADEPQDAAGFSRRGSAFAARRDYEHALADFDRACELAPDNPDYPYQHGSTLARAGQPAPALADFDRAIVLQPDHLPARLARAELRLRAGQVAEASIDLDTVDRAADKQADVRLGMAREYLQAERLPSALAQLDLWIAAHRDDSRLSEAQLERCWVRALSGQDLPKALEDCNAAFKSLGKSTGTGARVLASRGLVRLRLGDYDKALADFNESLQRQPRDPWALYGRGVDEMRRGMTAQGQADIAAATALWAPIAQKYSSHGVVP